jgi:hypothetical protein
MFHPLLVHTVGHVAMKRQSRKHRAVFSGDIMDQPLQVFHPEWNSTFCDDPTHARGSLVA